MTDSTDHLRLGRALTLDADFIAGSSLALLGMRGSGKTYATRVLVEELYKASVQTVVIDPMGVYWGLRAGADGSARRGLPIPVFGGSHGDAPLESSAGALMADLAVDEGLSMVLDLSEFGSRTKERTFAAAFFDRLYRRNHDLLHLVVDEADLFAPQRPAKQDAVLLRTMENIVRRGRNKGLGITMASQRPATVHKDVLTQINALVALRVTAPQDRDAIREWVRGQGEAERWAEIAPSLPRLGNGESWWWIPEENILKRTQVRKATTFDSSPTRKRGQSTRAPKTFADVDMDVIAHRMSETIERAKANNPTELRHRIQDLEHALSKAKSAPLAQAPPREVPVPVIDPEHLARLEAALGTLGDLRGDLTESAEDLLKQVDAHATRLADAAQMVDRVATDLGRSMATANKTPPSTTPNTSSPKPAPKRAVTSAPKPTAVTTAPTPPPREDRQVGDEVLLPARRRILDALAALESIGLSQARRTQVALWAGVSPKSSGYANNLGGLRTSGYIDYPGQGFVTLTDTGRDLATAIDIPLNNDALHEQVRSLVTPARWRILEPLITAYPDPLSRDALAEAAGVSAASSGYANNLGALRSLGLLGYPAPGYVAAESVLFLEGN